MLTLKSALAASVTLGSFAEANVMEGSSFIDRVLPKGEDLTDGKRSFAEICAENGFAFEEHTVTTTDGYILTVYRIPGNTGEVSHPKPPVFFQHGVFDSAYAWIMNYADIAPAFVASRGGYDVWLGNSRGNTYSREHVSLNPNHAKYWEFDW